jgi:hypothetical protein
MAFQIREEAMNGKSFAMAAVWLGLAAAGPAVAAAPDQQSACRPDVRRFCHALPQGSADDAYLACLQAHRPKLSAACRKMLEANGV